jgi:N-acetyl-anhydromuramyl-L-alanine amidase AmpD
MGDFLNLVYDNWTGDGNTHRPNMENTLGLNRFKTVEGLFNFYMMLFKVRIKNLDDVYNNPDENFYYFINANGNSAHYYIERDDIPLPQSVKDCFLIILI